MKKFILVMVLSLVIHQVAAQRIISNKLNVQFTYSLNKPLGSSDVVIGNYESPSLINNFRTGVSMGLEASYHLKKIWSLHIVLQKTSLDDWSCNDSERYLGAKYSIISANPAIQINTPFRGTGIWNRIQLFACLGPSLAIHTAKLSKATYSASGVNFDFENTSFFAPGFNFSAGMNLSVTNKVIAGCSFGVNQYWVSSVLMDDRTLSIGSLTARLGYRFGKNNRYKYAE